jgi:uncharacterized protein (DUF58 family)
VLLSPAVMQELSRRRLSTAQLHSGRARPRGGVGERPSRARGAGLEFAEFRPYVSGDDIRSLDAQASQRAGTLVVREYTVHQQLSVTVVLDASASMGLGQPVKFALARSLAAVFAYAGLSGGDVVQLACLGTGDLGSGGQLSARLGGQGRSTEALGWLAAKQVGRRPLAGQDATQGFSAGLRFLAPRVPKGSLCVVLSDFLDEDAPDGLRRLQARSEVLAVQVLSPQELDPALHGAGGPLLLLDAEAPPELPGAVVQLDRPTLEGYRAALADWNAALSTQITRQGGRLLSLSSATSTEEAIRRELLGRGLLA